MGGNIYAKTIQQIEMLRFEMKQINTSKYFTIGKTMMKEQWSRQRKYAFELLELNKNKNNNNNQTSHKIVLLNLCLHMMDK